MPDLAIGDLSANLLFPPALIKYLTITELKDLAGDALIILVNIFDDAACKHVSEDFIKKLISSLEFIVDQDTLNAVIAVLL